MSNLDITFCDNTSCKNYKCDRNQIHIYKESGKHEIWIGVFPNCKDYIDEEKKYE